MTLVLITSMINADNSIYTESERFQQTFNSITSVRQFIPDAHILFVEMSRLNKRFEDFIKEDVEYFVNPYIVCQNKPFGEINSLKAGVSFILRNNLHAKYNLILKLSGRHEISSVFNINDFLENISQFCFKKTLFPKLTCILFSIPKSELLYFQNLLDSIDSSLDIESSFYKAFDMRKIKFLDKMGTFGYRGSSGDLYLT